MKTIVKIKSGIIALMLFTITCFGQTTISAWETPQIIPYTVVEDPSGDLIVVGSVPGGAVLPGSTSNFTFTSDTRFVGKYNKTNQYWLWAKACSMTGNIRKCLSTNSSGDVFVVGTFGGAFVYDGSVIPATNGGTILLKISGSTGTRIWHFVENTGVAVGSFEIDGNSNCYFTARDPFTTGNLTIKGYLYKISSQGASVWKAVISASNGNNVNSSDVVISASGDCYLVGSYEENVTFSKNIKLTAVKGVAHAPTTNMFLAKYNSSGTPQWAVSGTAGKSQTAYAFQVDMDSEGNLYVGGNYGKRHPDLACELNLANNVVMANSPIPGAHADKYFLARYNSSGTAQWVRLLTATQGPTSLGMFVSSNNNIFTLFGASTRTTTTFYFDGNTVNTTAAGYIVSEFSSSGTYIDAYAPSAPTSTTNQISTGPPFNFADISTGLLVSGFYQNTKQFDASTSLTASSANAYTSCVCNMNGAVGFIAEYYNSSFRNATALSENDNHGTSVCVFPNPSNGVLTLRADKIIGAVKLYDLSGKESASARIEDNSGQLDISRLPAGVYFLKVQGQYKGIKVVKE